jgi:hypothetical protein
MIEINGLHLLIAVAVLFVFIAARSVQWTTITVRWRKPLPQFLMAQVLRKKRSEIYWLSDCQRGKEGR